MAVGCGTEQAGKCPATPGVKRIESHSVDQFGRPLDIPDREIAGFAGVQASGLLEQPERPRRLPCYRGNAFVDREAEQGRAHVHRQQQRGQRRSAGVAVGRQRDRDAMAAHRVDRRQLVFADEIERTRQNDGDGAGRGPSPPPLLHRHIRDDRPKARRTARRARRHAGSTTDRHAGEPEGRASAPWRNTCAVCSAEKAMPSQNASTASARPAAAIAGSISLQTVSI